MAEYCPLTVVAPLTLLLSYANQNRAQQESQSESFCFFTPFVLLLCRIFLVFLRTICSLSLSATPPLCGAVKKRQNLGVNEATVMDGELQ